MLRCLLQTLFFIPTVMFAAEYSKLYSEPYLFHDRMSSPKVRHLLNNLCSLPSTSYLEIGTWKGSTWISALFQNQKSVIQEGKA